MAKEVMSVPTLTLKIPAKLKEQAEEMAEKAGYQSVSAYVRTALREKIEEDMIRYRDEEDLITLEEARKLVKETDEHKDLTKNLQERSEKSEQKAEV